MNSLEGFVRQVIGWREYMRFIYEADTASIYKALGKKDETHQLKRTGWYDASTGIHPIDVEIAKVQTHSWSHHIVRLMVFLNFLKLAEYSAYTIYKWFSEMVSLDAYEWVMTTNIVAMGYFSSKYMQKPYISTSNYIIKMSNYPAKPEWTDLWDALFYTYLHNHKQQLRAGAAIYLRNLAYFERRLDRKTQQRMLTIANAHKNKS